MKVAALGDAHLGRSYLPYTVEGGVNQREWDFERSFEAAVALALAQEPDAVDLVRRHLRPPRSALPFVPRRPASVGDGP